MVANPTNGERRSNVSIVLCKRRERKELACDDSAASRRENWKRYYWSSVGCTGNPSIETSTSSESLSLVSPFHLSWNAFLASVLKIIDLYQFKKPIRTITYLFAPFEHEFQRCVNLLWFFRFEGYLLRRSWKRSKELAARYTLYMGLT